MAESPLELTFGVGLNPTRSGIHGSSQTLIVLPFPTSKQAPCAMRALVPSKLFQIGEAPLGVDWFSQFCLTLYFARKRLMHGQSLLDSTHQANLDRRAWLKSQNFLKPSPPSFWGQHNEDQAIGVKYCPSLDLAFHREFGTGRIKNMQLSKSNFTKLISQWRWIHRGCGHEG